MASPAAVELFRLRKLLGVVTLGAADAKAGAAAARDGNGVGLGGGDDSDSSSSGGGGGGENGEDGGPPPAAFAVASCGGRLLIAAAAHGCVMLRTLRVEALGVSGYAFPAWAPIGHVHIPICVPRALRVAALGGGGVCPDMHFPYAAPPTRHVPPYARARRHAFPFGAHIPSAGGASSAGGDGGGGAPREVLVVPWRPGRVAALSFSPDGGRLAVVGEDGALRLLPVTAMLSPRGPRYEPAASAPAPAMAAFGAERAAAWRPRAAAAARAAAPDAVLAPLRSLAPGVTAPPTCAAWCVTR